MQKQSRNRLAQSASDAAVGYTKNATPGSPCRTPEANVVLTHLTITQPSFDNLKLAQPRGDAAADPGLQGPNGLLVGTTIISGTSQNLQGRPIGEAGSGSTSTIVWLSIHQLDPFSIRNFPPPAVGQTAGTWTQR